jgi:hypothetical protein
MTKARNADTDGARLQWPRRSDFVTALEKAARLQFIDPSTTLIAWAARLYDPEGKEIGFGLGDTAGEAMVFAWLTAHDPDILIDGELNPENWLEFSPHRVPRDYRFKVLPPGTARPLLWAIDDPDEGAP